MFARNSDLCRLAASSSRLFSSSFASAVASSWVRSSTFCSSSAYDSCRRAAMTLNSSASAPSSSLLVTSIRCSNAPEPILAAAVWIDSIGRTSRRASSALVATASRRNATSRSDVRQIADLSGAYASLVGSSTKTRQPSGLTSRKALSTFVPFSSRPTATVSAVACGVESAARTCGSDAKLVCRRTRLTSGCVTSTPRESTAYA